MFGGGGFGQQPGQGLFSFSAPTTTSQPSQVTTAAPTFSFGGSTTATPQQQPLTFGGFGKTQSLSILRGLPLKCYALQVPLLPNQLLQRHRFFPVLDHRSVPVLRLPQQPHLRLPSVLEVTVNQVI